MSLFDIWGDLFGDPFTRRRERMEEQRRLFEQLGRQQRERFENARREHEKTRPRWHSTQPEEAPYKTGKYGRIYGSNPALWVQTKEKPAGKTIQPAKGKWKPQYRIEDVIVIDMRQITAQDFIRIAVKDLFMIDLEFSRIHPQFAWKSFNSNIDPVNVGLFVINCIELNRIPYPIEELV